MKLIVIFLLLALFLLKPAGAMTIWSQSQEMVAPDSQYSPTSSYAFQINWEGSNDSYAVSYVVFESNFSTLSELLDNATVPNISGNTYRINFTDLPAGNYAYRWYAVDNESNWNFTDQKNYSVAQNSSLSIDLYLNGTEASRNYNLNDIANFTAFLSLPSKTIYLISNYDGFIQQSSSSSVIRNITNLSSSGYFSITAYWNGDSNYLASNKTFYFDNTAPRFSSTYAYPSSPATYYAGMDYTFSIGWIDAAIKQVWFESNYTGSFINYTSITNPAVQNNSSTFFIALHDLSVKEFTYRWIASDSSNRISNTTRYTYDIVKRFPLTIEILPSNSVFNGTNTTVICSSSSEQVPASNFKLYRSLELIANDTLLSRKDDYALPPGIYEYICNSTETQNFTNQTILAKLNVSLLAPIVVGTSDISGPSSIQINLGDLIEKDFYLNNNLGVTLNNMSFSLSGIPSEWYKISDLPSSIPNNFSLIIRINFSIPTDAEQGKYNITLKAFGRTTEAKFVSKSVNLTVSPPPPPQNFPPAYSANYANKTSSGYEFLIKWNDDSGLSGYIFSSNMTGNWTNDSWSPFSGTENWAHVLKNTSIESNAVIAWKVYANDSNNLWSESDEFYVTVKKEEFDMTIPILLLSVFVVCLAALIFFIERVRPKRNAKKEEVVYVYKKEDVK